MLTLNDNERMNDISNNNNKRKRRRREKKIDQRIYATKAINRIGIRNLLATAIY